MNSIHSWMHALVFFFNLAQTAKRAFDPPNNVIRQGKNNSFVSKFLSFAPCPLADISPSIFKKWAFTIYNLMYELSCHKKRLFPVKCCLFHSDCTNVGFPSSHFLGCEEIAHPVKVIVLQLLWLTLTEEHGALPDTTALTFASCERERRVPYPFFSNSKVHICPVGNYCLSWHLDLAAAVKKTAALTTKREGRTRKQQVTELRTKQIWSTSRPSISE